MNLEELSQSCHILVIYHFVIFCWIDLVIFLFDFQEVENILSSVPPQKPRYRIHRSASASF